LKGILLLQRGQLKKTMTEFVYQVRVGEGYAMECLTKNYEMMNSQHLLFTLIHKKQIYHYQQNNYVLEHADDLPIHLVSEIEEMNKALKKSIECPFCLEVIEVGHLKISVCGHKVCDECVCLCGLCRLKILQNV